MYDIIAGIYGFEEQDLETIDWMVDFLVQHCTSMNMDMESYGACYLSAQFVFPLDKKPTKSVKKKKCKPKKKKCKPKQTKDKSSKKANIKNLNKFTGLIVE